MGWVQPQPNPTQQPYYWTKRTISPTDPRVGLKSKEFCLFGAQVNQVTWVGGIHWFPHLKDDSCLHSIERTRRNKEWMTAIRIGNLIDLTPISNPTCTFLQEHHHHHKSTIKMTLCQSDMSLIYVCTYTESFCLPHYYSWKAKPVAACKAYATFACPHLLCSPATNEEFPSRFLTSISSLCIYSPLKNLGIEPISDCRIRNMESLIKQKR